MLHPLLERLGLLLLPPGWQRRVMLANHQRAVTLAFPKTLAAQRTLVTVRAPFKPKVHFARALLFQAAALRALFSGRTNGAALLHVHSKILRTESPARARRGLSRTNHLAAFGLRLHQLFGRDIRPVHILDRRLLQPHLRLLLVHQLGPGLIAPGGWGR